MTLFHITTRAELDAATPTGSYTPSAFAQEGFIHCSYRHQVVAVANRIFHHQPDLVLLEIDPSRLSCPVVDENLEGGSEQFPHVYGPLPLPSVSQVHTFSCDADGQFTLPDAVAE